jgi:hypothetical protein
MKSKTNNFNMGEKMENNQGRKFKRKKKTKKKRKTDEERDRLENPRLIAKHPEFGVCYKTTETNKRKKDKQQIRRANTKSKRKNRTGRGEENETELVLTELGAAPVCLSCELI